MQMKMGSALPQLYKSPSELASLSFKSASLSAALAMMMSSASVLAASNQAAPGIWSRQPLKVAQSPNSTNSTNQSPDVIIDTTPQRPGSTPIPGSRTNSTTLSQIRFTCEVVNGQYQVMYHPQSKPNQSFAWATPSAMGSAWSPDRRCNEISRRLETYRPDGLVEMRTDVENGYNTVCVTTEAVPTCRIVLTVPSGQDPVAIRDRVFQNLTLADSGQVTQGVNTFVGGQGGGTLSQVLNNLGLPSILGGTNSQRSSNNNINLKPFLDSHDGGTGTQLIRGVSNKPSNGRQLNPNLFR